LWVVNGIVRQVESNTTLLREPEEFQLRGHKELLVLPADPDIEKIVSWPADRLTGNGSICHCVLWWWLHAMVVGSSGLSVQDFTKDSNRQQVPLATQSLETLLFFFFIYSFRGSPRTVLYIATHFIFSPLADQIVWHGTIAKGTDGPASPTSDHRDVTLVTST
jgi:hypothetical protein